MIGRRDQVCGDTCVCARRGVRPRAGKWRLRVWRAHAGGDGGRASTPSVPACVSRQLKCRCAARPRASVPVCVLPCNDVSLRAWAAHQVFFCIVGTLVAAAVIVHQGDYSGYHSALAEKTAKEAAVAARAAQQRAALPGGAGLTGYRTTPGTADPYQYIRTGHYAKILARERKVEQDAHLGKFHSAQHLTLDRWTEVNNPEKYKQELKAAAVARITKKANQARGVPAQGHLNVAGVKWPHVKEPSLQNNAMNPIAASGPGTNFFNEWLRH
jgi:hypothetical protein